VLNAIPASLLISETSAHGDAFASFGTTAREDGLSALGLHPRTEAVGLRTATAVRLKCTFGHETGALLLGNDCYEQTVSIRESMDLGKKALEGGSGSIECHPQSPICLRFAQNAKLDVGPLFQTVSA
jgi:hypothetical protein